MLVLSRKRGESIRIGDDVIITVLESSVNDKGNLSRVRIGITAPQAVKIAREEVYRGKNQPEASQDQP